MPDIQTYPKIETPEPNEAVKKSIAKPSAFSTPGSMQSKGMRFRALKVNREPGRPRKKKRDPRDVIFY